MTNDGLTNEDYFSVVFRPDYMEILTKKHKGRNTNA